MNYRNFVTALLRATLLFICGAAALVRGSAQPAPNRYALILADPPAVSLFGTREAVRSTGSRDYRQQIEARQRAIRTELAARKIPVTGSVTTLENAVFVLASKDQVPQLKALPGVKAVVPLRRYHMNLNTATQLVNANAAWNASGGLPNAGSGIKIGILDSGIDQTRPEFQDNSLSMPAGFPICTGTDCAFTSNRVIVARSYVRQLAAGSASDPAADSRPDDYSPRDRGGHGTAVASCAAGSTASGTVTINGMAPKAYLGNYKIYGSPEVNDTTADDVIIQALEDALNDGMDIVTFSSGGPAFSGPLDSGAACGNPAGVPCDLVAEAFENAANAGLIIVAASGNDGQSGAMYPAFNSIESPAHAPSVIAAGATTNSHAFIETVSAPGGPANLQNIVTESGDALVPTGAFTAPLVDVTQLGDDGFACNALPAGSLIGAVALIERGPIASPCSFALKMMNAENSGAAGVVFYMADSSAPVGPSGLANFYTPAVMIWNADGQALKSYIAGNPGQTVTVDPGGIEQSVAAYNQVAGFSSFGPSTGTSSLKPDLVAVGTDMYMAAEMYDPLGEVYSSNAYAVANGTSFSVPLVAGAAALVKQNHLDFTAAQVRSALINTASQDVTTDDSGNAVDARATGAGKLNAGAAVSATVTCNPATVSFGALHSGSLPKTQTVQVTNTGSQAVNLALTLTGNGGARLALDKSSLALPAGGSGTVTLTLSGSIPPAGSYYGAVVMQAQNVSLRVPYLYLVGDGVPGNIIPLTGTDFDGTVGQGIPDGIISFKLVDDYGLPIAGAPVSWGTSGGSFLSADSTTDAYGIAAAEPVLGGSAGNYTFTAVVAGARIPFTGFARIQPRITTIANAANFDSTSPVAPGSYIAISGSGLSDTSDAASATTLPLAIDYVNVSFDVPSAGISVPGHLIGVSPSQVVVQVPWELQGQSSAEVKVTIDYSTSNVVTAALADAAPALFETSPGVADAQDQNNNAITAGNPATGGETIQLFANGLGPVSNQPASGDPVQASAPAQTNTAPAVMIGGQPADVSFSGLVPGTAGRYQITVTVPPNAGTELVPVTVSAGSQASRQSGIWLQ